MIPVQYTKKGLNIESALPASIFLNFTQCNGFTDRYLDNNYVNVVIPFLIIFGNSSSSELKVFIHLSIEIMRKHTKLTHLVLMQIKSS